MLYGKKVVLRPITHEDLPNYVRWLTDPEVLLYFGKYLPMNLDQEEDWYHRQRDDPTVLNLAITYEGEHIGGTGFQHLNHRERNAEVGLFIGEKSLWDQGLGQDTLATMLRYGFEQLNLHRIYLRVFAENQRGIRAYEKVGFVTEGRLRQVVWRHGRWHDILIMSVLYPEWERLHHRE
jgi:RimJ/RimL family protein N-acetyltransferase